MNFFLHDSKNWIFCNMTQRIVSFLSIWLEELNPFWIIPKNWTFFFMTQRIEPFLWDSKNWIFFVIQRIEPFFLNFLWFDSKKWIFWNKTWHEELNLFSNMTQRIEPFWRFCDFKNLKLFWDSGDGTFFFNLNQRIKRFFNCCSKMMDPFLNMTHRNFSAFSLKELVFLLTYDAKFKEMDLFLQMSRRLEISFRNMSVRIKPFCKILEELIIWKNINENKETFWWLKKLNSFF